MYRARIGLTRVRSYKDASLWGKSGLAAGNKARICQPVVISARRRDFNALSNDQLSGIHSRYVHDARLPPRERSVGDEGQRVDCALQHEHGRLERHMDGDGELGDAALDGEDEVLLRGRG